MARKHGLRIEHTFGSFCWVRRQRGSTPLLATAIAGPPTYGPEPHTALREILPKRCPRFGEGSKLLSYLRGYADWD